MNKPLSPETLFLNVAQVADRFGVSNDTIWRWKRDGDFPKAVKVGPSTTRWRLADIEEHERGLQCCFAASI